MEREYKIGFLHYWNYFKCYYWISLKSQFEFKINVLSSFFVVLFWDLSFLVFGLVASDIFLDLIGWEFVDFVLFLLITYTITNIANQFIDDKYLENLIPSGELNEFLYIPGNRVLNYILSINFNYFTITIGNFLIFLPFIIFSGAYTFKYVFFASILIILLIFSYLCFYMFLNSISFFSLKSMSYLDNLFSSADRTFQSYTPLLFYKSPLFFILFLFESFYVAKLIIPLFKGVIVENFFIYVFILLLLAILFFIGLILNWHYGLKKYEAFG